LCEDEVQNLYDTVSIITMCDGGEDNVRALGSDDTVNIEDGGEDTV